MISPQMHDEMVETILQFVLQQLDGADDDDTIRARLVLEDWIEHMRGFKVQRPHVPAMLQQAIDDEITVGELRRKIRVAIENLARDAA